MLLTVTTMDGKGGVCAIGIQWVELRDAVRYPAVHRTAPDHDWELSSTKCQLCQGWDFLTKATWEESTEAKESFGCWPRPQSCHTNRDAPPDILRTSLYTWRVVLLLTSVLSTVLAQKGPGTCSYFMESWYHCPIVSATDTGSEKQSRD